jgi:hypothetical protein
MKKLNILFVLAVFLCLFTGCTVGDPNNPKVPLISPKGLMGIGETMQIEYIQHFKDNKYQIAYKDSDNHLQWADFGSYSNMGNIVIIDSNTRTALVKRLPDHKQSLFGLESLKDEYELHLPDKYPISGGEYNAGTSESPDQIKTEIIYPHQ